MSGFLSELVACAPRLDVQLALLALQSALWWLFMTWSSQALFAPFIRAQPWRNQWTRLNRKTFKKSMFIDFKTDAEALDFACLFLAIIAQHFVGGALCLPSVLGMSFSASALARHGALCEAGWELQDFISRAHQLIWQGPRGKAKNPPALVLILTVHHVMGQSMCIPMNLYYGDNRDYHEFVFLLQFAACIAMTLQNYGYTVDAKTQSGLLQMKLTVVVSWLVICYSRVLRYGFLGYKLASTFYADGNMTLCYVGGTSLALMGLINLLFFLDATGKLVKFVVQSQHCDAEYAAVEVNGALQRAHSGVLLRNSQRSWAKLRGAVLLGAMSPGKKSGAQHGDEHPAFSEAEPLRQRSSKK